MHLNSLQRNLYGFEGCMNDQLALKMNEKACNTLSLILRFMYSFKGGPISFCFGITMQSHVYSSDASAPDKKG